MAGSFNGNRHGNGKPVPALSGNQNKIKAGREKTGRVKQARKEPG